MNVVSDLTTRLCTGLLLLIMLGVPPAKAEEPLRWETLYTTEGITVSAGHRKSADLPVLRGVGTLNVNLYHLLAIVEDAGRHHEWVHRVAKSEILERPDAFNLTAYMRFDFPWPAWDRDGVVRVTVERKWSPFHEVWVRFYRSAHRTRPETDGVVRVPQSKGFTRLRWVSPHQTQVIYQIDTDPGGRLPRWLVRWIAKDLPAKILAGLKTQVRKTATDYQPFIAFWDPRKSWQDDSPETFKLPGTPIEVLAPRPDTIKSSKPER